MSKTHFIEDANIEWEILDDFCKRKIMAYNEGLMMVKVHFKKGGVGAIHQHVHSQGSFVESGVFEVNIAGEKKILANETKVISGIEQLKAGIGQLEAAIAQLQAAQPAPQPMKQIDHPELEYMRKAQIAQAALARQQQGI